MKERCRKRVFVCTLWCLYNPLDLSLFVCMFVCIFIVISYIFARCTMNKPKSEPRTKLKLETDVWGNLVSIPINFHNGSINHCIHHYAYLHTLSLRSFFVVSNIMHILFYRSFCCVLTRCIDFHSFHLHPSM